jgi:hypothetical protein
MLHGRVQLSSLWLTSTPTRKPALASRRPDESAVAAAEDPIQSSIPQGTTYKQCQLKPCWTHQACFSLASFHGGESDSFLRVKTETLSVRLESASAASKINEILNIQSYFS